MLRSFKSISRWLIEKSFLSPRKATIQAQDESALPAADIAISPLPRSLLSLKDPVAFLRAFNQLQQSSASKVSDRPADVAFLWEEFAKRVRSTEDWLAVLAEPGAAELFQFTTRRLVWSVAGGEALALRPPLLPLLVIELRGMRCVFVCS